MECLMEFIEHCTEVKQNGCVGLWSIVATECITSFAPL